MDTRLIWMALGTFAVGTGAFVIASLLPGISGEFGVTTTQAGLLVTVFAIAYAIGTPILSALTGGADRRTVLTAALLVYAVSNLAAGVAPSYVTLMLARVFMAVASGVFAATAQGTAALMAAPDRRARAIAVIVGGTTLSVALGAPLGAFIANIMSWRAAFLSLGGVSLLVTAAIWLMLPKGLPGTKLNLRDRLMVVTRPGISRALLVTVASLAAVFSVFTYVASLAKAMGLGQDLLPLVLIGFGGGAVIGNFAAGRLADRFGPSRTVGWVIAAVTLIMAVFSLEAHLLPIGVAGWTLVASMVAWGFVGWGFPPAQSSYVVSLAPEVAPVSLALNASAIYAGIAFGSAIGGAWLAAAPVTDIGFVGAALGLVALAIHTLRPAPALQRAKV
jgi:predicted MFS family arabinose efflux permease